MTPQTRHQAGAIWLSAQQFRDQLPTHVLQAIPGQNPLTAEGCVNHVIDTIFQSLHGRLAKYTMHGAQEAKTTANGKEYKTTSQMHSEMVALNDLLGSRTWRLVNGKVSRQFGRLLKSVKPDDFHTSEPHCGYCTFYLWLLGLPLTKPTAGRYNLAGQGLYPLPQVVKEDRHLLNEIFAGYLNVVIKLANENSPDWTTDLEKNWNIFLAHRDARGQSYLPELWQFINLRLSQQLPGIERQHATAHELELASELLEIEHEQQLEQLLDEVASRATTGQFLGSPTGQALGAILKDAADQALPVVGAGTATNVARSGVHDWGRTGAAGQLFEMELEGLPAEDKEFELARRYVQWATDAARRAAHLARRAQAPPPAIARQAATEAAHQYAPGLVDLIDPSGPGSGAPPPGNGNGRSGRWVRHGRHIVVYLGLG